ncbi:protein MAIN-LIKE 2-like [Chenopodium quinoa]|uniref:protein MAIN-LIKE 2-like n=1 Tax=Chenopodium quinoa TaxID=63459 RepID=UPI000B771FC7|nr:protein MAIN-LIKE 2-like [Chenopodium quinoa]XP_021729681.1 protein MAIN-LIKE 2-like [Chenopodium quinoa]
MDLYAFNPGPLDDSVLYDQEKHVSSAVWEGQERGALRCHEHTSKLNQWVLTPKQIELIDKAGFGYLKFIPAISIDNPLISALVERWRRETNTFHLTVGEMTVTLEDVAYLLGLAIDGEPVIGVTYTSCDAVCERYLGKAPDSGYTSGGMVKLSWLKECFSRPENASTEDIKRHTRAYLLYLVGSTIFSTTTGNKVPVMYLPLFEDFDHSARYAWGAAALAFLYRALGNASLRSQSTVSGGLTLLQCWSYFHLNIGRPKLPQDSYYDTFPLVLRWKGKQNGPTTNRDITFYRKALDSLKPADVDWFPYQNVDPMVIPDNIASSLILGRSKTMLICFDKAERHLPDRCMRQYGMPNQPIPESVDRWERKSRGVDGGVDLSGKMELELKEWSERHIHIMHSGEDADDSKYMHWYLRITCRFVGRPIPLASEFQRMNATLREVAHISDTMSLQGLDNEQIHSITRIRYIIHECLRDQAGSVVTVASPSPENENCNKRGRGKEKIRRKGMGKRRRKDELEQCEEDNTCRDDQLIPNYALTDIEYVQQMHHPVRLVNHHHPPCHPDIASVNEEDMDESQLCISVNEVGDAQICLHESGVVTAMPSCDDVDGSQPSDFIDHQDGHCPPSDEDTKLDHENGMVPDFANEEEPSDLSDEDTKVDEHGANLIQREDHISSPLDDSTQSPEMPMKVHPHSSHESEEDISRQSNNGIKST